MPPLIVIARDQVEGFVQITCEDGAFVPRRHILQLTEEEAKGMDIGVAIEVKASILSSTGTPVAESL